MSFILELSFEPNKYFTNEVLTKTYRMRSEPNDSSPFSFDGPEIMGYTGCQTDWKKGKNVTLKTIKKKQKHKGCGTVHTATKTVSNDSSFSFLFCFFFALPEVPKSGDLGDDAEAILTADSEIGHFLFKCLFPSSSLVMRLPITVLYYVLKDKQGLNPKGEYKAPRKEERSSPHTSSNPEKFHWTTVLKTTKSQSLLCKEATLLLLLRHHLKRKTFLPAISQSQQKAH
ncbi:hypothetical protein GH733_014390, partial [Mirounga leonina]